MHAISFQLSTINYQDPAAQSLPTLLRLSIAAASDTKGHACSGTVRLTSVPILANRLFAHNLRDPVAMQPSLVVELIADRRVFNLNCREADVAFRLARPTASVMGVMARRIGTLAHAPYAWRGMRCKVQSLPAISYEDAISHLPPTRWMELAS